MYNAEAIAFLNKQKDCLQYFIYLFFFFKEDKIPTKKKLAELLYELQYSDDEG